MRRSSLYTSAVFHGVLIILGIVGLPFLSKREFVIPPPVTVEIADLAKVTQTTQVTPKPTPPKPEPEKPKPAAPNSEPQPAPPVKEPPKEEEKKEPPKPNKAEEIDENAPPEKDKKKETKKPEPKKQQPPRDFSSVLKNLDVSKTPPAPAPGQNAPIGEKLTISEEDALRAQLERCWNVPFGAKDAENTVVEILMVINPDRTLREAKVVDTARYNSDEFFRAMADSALRAVRSSLCSPFELPPDKYDTWSTTTVTFNPKDMF